MAKLLFTLLVCVVLPAVVLCRPQINQSQPQIQPPISSPGQNRPSILPAKPETSEDVIAPDASPASPVIGNHVQPGVIVEEPAASASETTISSVKASPSVLAQSVIGCPRFYKPVCGSDNKTYNTECELKMAQGNDSTLTKSSEGPCAEKTE